MTKDTTREALAGTLDEKVKAAYVALRNGLAGTPNAERLINNYFEAVTRMTVDTTRAALSSQPPAPNDAVRDVLAERKRQIEVEGWTPNHDDEHRTGGMAVAAACYAAWTLPSRPASEVVSTLWPWTGWAQKWFKPKDTRSNLIRAGALILAEIERLDRAALQGAAP